MLNVISGLLAGGVAASTNSYESIATVTVGAGGSASISFTSIPSTYKHLQVRYIARDARATTGLDDMILKFNAGASATYSWHRLVGDGATAGAAASPSQTQIVLSAAGISRGGNTSGIFTAGVIDILDYQDTNKYKTVRSLYGGDLNGSGGIALSSGLWYGSTNAIASMDFTTETATNFSQYSSFALYGIKG